MGEKIVTFLGRGEFWIAGSALAAFLVLSWALRGAPPGQSAGAEEDADAPRAGHRDRIVFGVAFGLVLILAGAYMAVDRGIPWSLPLFAIGFGLVLALTRLNRRYRHASPSLRRTLDFSESFLDVALLAGILIVMNVLAFRYGGRPLDMTREGTYSLTATSLAQVKALDRPVTFTLISGRGPLADRQRTRVFQLLESYRSASPGLIRIAELNPYVDLARSEELSKRVPELALLHGGGVLIEYGEGKDTAPTVVRNQELFERVASRQPATDRFETSFSGEDAITSALQRLREGKGAKVAFTVGHGEPKIDDVGGRGLGNWRARLARVGCEVAELNLDRGEIPQDVSLVIVVGPTDPFKPAEVARLRAYSDRGGPILMLLGNTGSPQDARRPTGLEEFLGSFNLEIGKGVVLDPSSNYQGVMGLVYVPSRSGDHPIAAAMEANRRLLIAWAAPIYIAGMVAPPGGKGAEVADRNLVPTPILKANPTSWAESEPNHPRPTLDRSTEPTAPIVGVAVARRSGGAPHPGASREEQPRLVLFSSPLMAENSLQDITLSPANLDLLMNAASWLRGRPDTLGISPKTHAALTLTVDPLLASRLIVVPTVTALLLIVAIGIIVYFARRE